MTRTEEKAELAGSRVVITGGASGIGLATAGRFAAAGARVVLVDRDEEASRRALAENPGLAGHVRADVSDHRQVEEAFARIDETLGGIDVLISNAGISERLPFLEIDPEAWRRVLGVNLDGMFFCCREAARRMMAGSGGTLLLTASTNGMVGHRLYASYNASKAGVILLAKTLALELAPRVRVNAVCPGYVLTPMQEREYTPEMLRQVNAAIPLGRHAAPREIAELFLFLASERGRYFTGQTLTIDGGETCGGTASWRPAV
ncbi:MAG TPA: SDR family oxidoreductase [Thermoanaerobaculia bacterium]|nr:SDR family oxidoreductase [Thermoanaerobaculia bacterium]